ncbi:MAG: 4Fe-4S dicluster domain-containing protein [Halanaerobiales bacterium]|nr:4Fe-4S dicluster domain-containing protein [Halanaerobiales bacterium]
MKKQTALFWLKITLIIYILATIFVASLNYGMQNIVSPKQAKVIHQIYKIFENEFKISLILICSFLSWQVLKKQKNNKLQKINLIAFSTTALFIHGIIPWLLNNRELYYFFMPLPWSSLGLQLLDSTSTYYTQQLNLWGVSGIFIAVVFFLISNGVVLLGTLMIGRRWQCSYLCMLNGFVSEIWSKVFPIFGKKKKISSNLLKFLNVFRWIMLGLSLILTTWWLFRIFGIPIKGSKEFISEFEVIKYLSLELLMMMFLWIIWTGRGYCYYCPLGAFLSLISKVIGQKIKTDNTHCINCNQCTQRCPMSIDIAKAASKGKAVNNLRCVGCGHCIDICPTRTLSYETHFIKWWRTKFNHPIVKKD